VGDGAQGRFHRDLSSPSSGGAPQDYSRLLDRESNSRYRSQDSPHPSWQPLPPPTRHSTPPRNATQIVGVVRLSPKRVDCRRRIRELAHSSATLCGPWSALVAVRIARADSSLRTLRRGAPLTQGWVYTHVAVAWWPTSSTGSVDKSSRRPTLRGRQGCQSSTGIRWSWPTRQRHPQWGHMCCQRHSMRPPSMVFTLAPLRFD
jgi:hypothetical protein